MGSRKRLKPHKVEADTPLPAQHEAQKPESRASPESSTESAVQNERTQAPEAALITDPRSIKGWYGGAWPRGAKAASVTQVLKESISASGGPTSDHVLPARPNTPKCSSAPLKNPEPYISRSIGSSSRSLPLAATTTKLNITSNAASIPNSTLTLDREAKSDEVVSKGHIKILAPALDKLPEKDDPGTACEVQPVQGNSPFKAAELQWKPISEDGVGNTTSGWLGWFSKPAQPVAQNPEPVNPAQGNVYASSVATNRSSSFNQDSLQNGKTPPDQCQNSDPNPVPQIPQQEQQSRSWLSLWSSTNVPSERGTATPAAEPPGTTPRRETEDASNPEQLKIGYNDVTQLTSENSSQTTDIGRSQGWSFWSKDRSRDDHTSNVQKENVGKLALAGSPSHSRPENAVVEQARDFPSKSERRERPESLKVTDDAGLPNNPKGETERRANTTVIKRLRNIKPTEETAAKASNTAANLLLPPFKRTYRVAEPPSLLQHLSRILKYTQVPDTKHLDLVLNPPRIKRALAIGVHGYFPAPLIRSVLGQPTGTSIRFANGAASALQRWTQNHGYSCEVEKVALEGEGKIAERIDLLWKLMLNWIENIRKADFVMIACHSQGVPVAISLVAKLISFGCVNTAKIGICAMAGVNLGPFADYKSRWIGGSAGELFDFARPESQVSRDYEAALEAALKFGVKIVYIGSIDDQLVSLESSTFAPISHPYIYRAVFVDGRVHAPDFLTHLVGFALKLRNLGISDHGLIRELSSPLAGSLYGGEGHSRIYDDDSVYYIAVEHALETTSLGNIPLKMQRDGSGTSQNPYILPFAIRGVLEEEYVRTELANETTELLRQFDDWKPSSKVLKDVKFRLEGVRSKL